MSPWKAVNPDYIDVNTVAQGGEKLTTGQSHIGLYRELIKLSTEQASVKFGDTKISALSNTTLASTR